MQVPGLQSSLLTGLCPSILLLCSSPFMGLVQHLSGRSQPARTAEGCSQGSDCCNSAGSHCISMSFCIVVTSVYRPPSHHLHRLNCSLQPHLDAVRPLSLAPPCLLLELSGWLSISSSLFPKCFGITPLPAGPRLDLLAMLEISSKALSWQQKEKQRLLGAVSNWARHTVSGRGNPSPEVPLTQAWAAALACRS